MAFDPRLHDEPDAILLAQCRQGDGAAAAELYRRHATAVYRFVLMATGSAAEAADVLQETFMLLLERPVGFDPTRGSCTAYLCGVARHLMARRFDRRNETRADPEELVDETNPAAAPPLPEDALERSRALERLSAAIRALPPHYRDVLILVELQEMSYGDAAAIVGIELGTIRSRLSRARARLVELLRVPAAKNSETQR